MKVKPICRILHLILVAFSISSTCQYARAQAVSDWIESVGSGETEEKATTQALRNVIQQQVGTYIDAETIVANETVLKDEILDYSAGFVENYERLGVSVQDGVTEVRIRAKVREDKLQKRIKESFKASAEVDGQSVFQKATIQIEKQQKAARLLQAVASEFPEKAIAIEVGAPEILRTFTDGSAEIGLNVQFSMAPEFVARLQQVVRAISPKCSRLNSLSQIMSGWDDIRQVKCTGVVFASGGQYEFCALSFSQYWAIIAAIMSGDRFIWPERGQWFKFGSEWAEQYPFPSQIQPRIRLELLDESKSVIQTKDFDAFGDLYWLLQEFTSTSAARDQGWWYFAEGLVRLVFFDTSDAADGECPPIKADLSSLPYISGDATGEEMSTIPPEGARYRYNALLMINSSATKTRLYKWQISLDALKNTKKIAAYYVCPLKQVEPLANQAINSAGDERESIDSW